jgi:hypothetical protein
MLKAFLLNTITIGNLRGGENIPGNWLVICRATILRFEVKGETKEEATKSWD